MTAVAKKPHQYRTFRISPGDTNRLAIVFDPVAEQVPFITCVEIFDVGGKTSPNVHHRAHEMFFVLKGQGQAFCNGERTAINTGDSLLLPPGATMSYDINGFSQTMKTAGVALITDPELIKQKSRDFYWFSPIIEPQLAHKTAELVVQPAT